MALTVWWNRLSCETIRLVWGLVTMGRGVRVLPRDVWLVRQRSGWCVSVQLWGQVTWPFTSRILASERRNDMSVFLAVGSPIASIMDAPWWSAAPQVHCRP